jgi:hypothetical protein
LTDQIRGEENLMKNLENFLDLFFWRFCFLQKNYFGSNQIVAFVVVIATDEFR